MQWRQGQGKLRGKEFFLPLILALALIEVF